MELDKKQNNITTAIMLVGGASLRMMPYTTDRPKAMVDINGKPILYWTLKWLKFHGIKKVVLGVAYKKEVIFDYLSKNDFGLEIKFSEHTVDGETGEGFRLAIERYIKDEQDFVAMNGDELTNMDLRCMMDTHLESESVVTIVVSSLKSPYGIVEIYGGKIIGFKEKPILEDKLMSVGIYIFNKKIKSYLPKSGTIEKETFPVLANKKFITAYRLNSNEHWTTVNTIKDIKTAEEELKLWGFDNE